MEHALRMIRAGIPFSMPYLGYGDKDVPTFWGLVQTLVCSFLSFFAFFFFGGGGGYVFGVNP